MALEQFQARSRVDGQDTMVDVLGRRLSENFALTIAVQDMGIGGSKPSVITHIPSGLRIYQPHYVSSAKKIALALEAMPVDWADDDEDRLVSASATHWKAEDSSAGKFFVTLDVSNRKAPPTMLDKLKKTSAWKGAEITPMSEYKGRINVVVARKGNAEAVLYVTEAEFLKVQGESL